MHFIEPLRSLAHNGDCSTDGCPVLMPEKPSPQIELPAPDTKAWGSRRKAAVVLGIRKGMITREQAYEMYRLSPEELASWDEAFDRGGYRALALKARDAAR